MLKRGSKSSYNPYSTSQRVKKAEAKGKDRLDILPNKHSVWLKQVRLSTFTSAKQTCRTDVSGFLLGFVRCSSQAPKYEGHQGKDKL